MKCKVVFSTKSGMEDIERDFTYVIDHLDSDVEDFKKFFEIRIARKFEALIKKCDWINADNNLRVRSDEIEAYEIVFTE